MGKWLFVLTWLLQLSLSSADNAPTSACVDRLHQIQLLRRTNTSKFYFKLFLATVDSIRNTELQSSGTEHDMDMRKSFLVSKIPEIIKELEKRNRDNTGNESLQEAVRLLNQHVNSEGESDNAANHDLRVRLVTDVAVSLVHSGLVDSNSMRDIVQTVDVPEFTPLSFGDEKMMEDFDLAHHLMHKDIFNQRRHLDNFIETLNATEAIIANIRCFLLHLIRQPRVLDLFLLHGHLPSLLDNSIRLLASICSEEKLAVISDIHDDFSILLVLAFVTYARCGSSVCIPLITRVLKRHLPEKLIHLHHLRQWLIKTMAILSPLPYGRQKDNKHEGVNMEKVSTLITQLREHVVNGKTLEDIGKLKNSIGPLQMMQLISGITRKLFFIVADKDEMITAEHVSSMLSCLSEFFGPYVDFLLAQEMIEMMTNMNIQLHGADLTVRVLESFANHILQRKRKIESLSQFGHTVSGLLVHRIIKQHLHSISPSMTRNASCTSRVDDDNVSIIHQQECTQMLVRDERLVFRWPIHSDHNSSSDVVFRIFRSLMCNLRAPLSSHSPKGLTCTLEPHDTINNAIPLLHVLYTALGGCSFMMNLITELSRAMQTETNTDNVLWIAELAGFAFASVAGPHHVAHYLDKCIPLSFSETSFRSDPMFGKILARFSITAVTYSRTYIHCDNTQYRRFLQTIMEYMECSVRKQTTVHLSSIYALSFVEMASLVPEVIRVPLLEQLTEPQLLFKLLSLYGDLCPEKKHSVCPRFFDLGTEIGRELCYVFLERS